MVAHKKIIDVTKPLHARVSEYLFIALDAAEFVAGHRVERRLTKTGRNRVGTHEDGRTFAASLRSGLHLLIHRDLILVSVRRSRSANRPRPHIV